MIGGNGFGDRCTIRRCYGRYSGDVGVETDAMLNAVVEDVIIDDSAGGNFFSINYNIPARTLSGAPVTQLNGAITNSATSITVDSVPVGVARSGWLVIDSELMSYTASADNSNSVVLTVVRGLNGTTASSHTDNTKVTFHEAEKQTVKYRNCKSRHFDLSTVESGTWMPKGWYQLPSIFVNPQLIIENCSYENFIVGMGLQSGGGSADGIHVQGEIVRVVIDGLEMDRHSVHMPDQTTSTRGALISLISNSGTKTRSSIYIRDVRARISGRMGAGTSPPAYVHVYLDNGNWILDWKSIDIISFLAGAQPGTTALMNFSASAGNAIAGVIEDVRYRNDRGDLAPVGLRIPAYPQCDIQHLAIKGWDLSSMLFSPNASSSNYSPFVIDSVNAQKVRFEDIVHSNLATTSRISSRIVGRTNVVTSNYTLTANDEYVGVGVSAPVTITLLPASGGSGGSLPKPTASKSVVIKDEFGNAATNNITVTAASGETIDGAATKIINTNYGLLRLRSNGSAWMTV